MAWNQPGKGNQDPWRGKGPAVATATLDGLRAWAAACAMPLAAAVASDPLRWLVPLLALLLVFNSFKLIDEQQRGVVLRFGQFDRIMTPGAELQVAVADRNRHHGQRHQDRNAGRRPSAC